MSRYPTPEAFDDMFKTVKSPDGTTVSQVMPFLSLK